MKVFMLVITCIFLSFLSRTSWANSPTIVDHQCEKSFSYDIYLHGLLIGHLTRQVSWQDNQARIQTSSEVDILGIGASYQQLTDLYWSVEQKQFLTRAFSQKVVGVKSRDVVATFSPDGRQASVSLNGEVTKYSNKEHALLDLDTLGTQIRLNIINGLTRFQLFRQAYQKVIAYQFQITAKEELDLPRWGKLEVIRLDEVADHEGTTLWFSPKLDHQLVKAKFNLLINPTVYLSAYKIDCSLRKHVP